MPEAFHARFPVLVNSLKVTRAKLSCTNATFYGGRERTTTIFHSPFEPAFKRILQQENSPKFDNLIESNSKLHEV